jgi:hypothetical protein
MKILSRNITICFMIISFSPSSFAIAKGGIGEIFAGLIAGSIAKTTGPALVDDLHIDQALTKLCNHLNKQVPKMVDKETRLDNVTPGPGRHFTYNYTFPNFDLREIEAVNFFPKMKKQLIDKVCQSEDMKLFFEQKITISYDYKDRNGIGVGKIDISATTCRYNY